MPFWNEVVKVVKVVVPPVAIVEAIVEKRPVLEVITAPVQPILQVTLLTKHQRARSAKQNA